MKHLPRPHDVRRQSSIVELLLQIEVRIAAQTYVGVVAEQVKGQRKTNVKQPDQCTPYG